MRFLRLGSIVIALGGLLFFVGCRAAEAPTEQPLPVLTLEQIADNFAEFFSVLYDGQDMIFGGTLRRDSEGDRFILKVNLDTPFNIVEREVVVGGGKTLSEDRRTLKVEPVIIRRQYEIAYPSFLGKPVSRTLILRRLSDGRRISTPVQISLLIVTTHIDKQSAHALQSLKPGSHEVQVMVYKSQWCGEAAMGDNDGTSLACLIERPLVKANELYILPVLIEKVNGIEIKPAY